MPQDPPRLPPDRPRPRVHWAVVVGLLLTTFVAMLAAIYWVVRSARF